MMYIYLLGLDLAAFDKKTSNSKIVVFNKIEVYFTMK